ncbi:MAG TPA: hypothetical protein ENN21_11655 [Spirochaetes bacterium]|nr:hypothetical protein [Spirochaetota bacterium]
MNVKYNKIIPAVFCVAAMIVCTMVPEKAFSRLETNVPADISESELKAVVVEDFEKQSDWTIESVPKKNADEKKNPVPVLELKYVEGNPSDLIPERWTPDKKGMEKKLCLGVHFKFKYPGFNSVHLLPPPEVQWDDATKKVMTYDPRAGKEVQERAIQLPGRAKGVSVWFHGRGNDYNLECWVKDYKGDVHILKMGSLNFVGWRPMKVMIPEFVPQESQSYPQVRVTKIVRFVIRATPYAGTDDVYMFFDQLKVLTDVFEVNFDGQELHKAFQGGHKKEDSAATK